MRKSLFIIFIYCSSLSAQSFIQFEDFFFQSEKSDSSTIPHDVPSFTPKWIEEVEIRTETNRFELDRQRINLRISPASKKINQASVQLADSYTQKLSLLEKNINERIQINEYKAVLQAAKVISRNSLNQELLTILRDQDKVYQKLLDNKSNYSVRWLDIKREISELEIDLYQDKRTLSLLVPDNVVIKWDNLITIQDIVNRIKTESIDINTEDANSESQLNKKILGEEIALRKAESTGIFDFLQIEYRGPSNNLFEEKYSITGAFRLPFLDSKSRLKITELELKKLELESELVANRKKLITELSDLRQDIIVLSEIYELQKESLTENKKQTDIILSKYSELNSDPLFILQHKGMLLSDQKAIHKSKYEILEKYIEYQFSKGVIYNNPNQNILLPN